MPTLTSLRLTTLLSLAWLCLLAGAHAASDVRFVGRCTWQMNAAQTTVVFTAQSIQNFSNTRTNNLRMEMWATQDIYSGSGLFVGHQMARATINPINAGASFNNATSNSLPLTLPAPGFWRIYLIITEFTGHPLNDGYEIVDEAITDTVYNRRGGNGQLSNISVRTVAGSGANTLITGFSVAGGASKDILVRSVGPTLANFGVSGAMSDPSLRLFDGAGVERLNNDNWGGTATLRTAFSRLGAFALPDNSRDAAILGTFTSGSFTAQTTGPTSGVTLVELYDAGGPANLVNASVRANAGSGDSTLIAGFNIVGQPRTVLIRAVGPTLGAFGVGGAMADPVLTVYRGSDRLYSNDDWSNPNDTTNLWSATQIQTAADSVGAFRLPNGSLDAVVMITLQPGSYSATVTGVNGGTGVALLELYTVTP